MSQHFNSMLEHLKMGPRRTAMNTASPSNNNNNINTSGPGVQCSDVAQVGGGGRESNVNCSEKSPISALIQKFSSCTTSSPSSSSSSSSAASLPSQTCPATTGGSIVQSTTHSNNVNGTNSPLRMTQHRKSSTSAALAHPKVDGTTTDVVDCAVMVPSSDEKCLIRAKLNNSNNNSSSAKEMLAPPSTGKRKGSDTGQLRALLQLEEKNGTRTNCSGSNGHLVNSARKLSADFRLNHRDLLSGDENGKHFGHKPARVKNLANRTEAYDMLHHKTTEKVSVGGVGLGFCCCCSVNYVTN